MESEPDSSERRLQSPWALLRVHACARRAHGQAKKEVTRPSLQRGMNIHASSYTPLDLLRPRPAFETFPNLTPSVSTTIHPHHTL